MKRFRRLRMQDNLRPLIREHSLSLHDLVYPLFIVEGEGIKEEIPSMPDVYHFSIDKLKDELDELDALGLKTLLIFGVPDSKDSHGHSAYDEKGIVQKAVRAIKSHNDSFYVITDVCMCSYTDHGHCGIIDDSGNVMNDITTEYLAQIALSHVKAGADMVAPSDMMDGRIKAMRDHLDENGFEYVPIMSYALKYSSNYYGPFRVAADSSPKFGNRKRYQMDYHNKREILDIVHEDIQDGADLIMVKPAMMYLDLIQKVKENCSKPVVAYNVSGEYSLIKQGIISGLVDEAIIYETMIGFKRAGADIIITYFAKEIVRKWLSDDNSAI
ncbi:porphobilinogen synthase [Fusibacter ferrireducens]|uniref:Delta-aminolevulinic acid dehydratase n=1 Tax=Fusibacter ferrireducens TaxID=2785058 RepID=A0ABR9ZS27_9FIRM|nr:porphobilinogen synthase [Fusibacter ferrireducens]MBF4693245.1 porphobilinogen synthase [Fusibacter ferrireducens]